MNTYKIHGSLIASRLKYISDCWGIDSKQFIINLLPIKEKLLIKNSLSENTWFDFSTLTLIDQLIVDKLANGNPKILHQLGRYSAEYSFHRLPTQLINQDLQDLFKNFSRVNAMFHNFGQIHVANFTSNLQFGHVSLNYSYPLDIPKTFCISALGYFERLLELLGYFVIKVSETSCEAEIGTHCYDLYWQAIALENLFIPVKVMANTKNQDTLISPTITQQITRTNNKILNTNNSTDSSKALKPYQLMLSTIIVLLLAFSLIQSSKTLGNNNVSREKVLCYQSTNISDLTLSLDSPYLVLKSAKTLSKVTLTAQVGNKTYSYKVAQIPSDRVLEVSLGEFTCPNGQAFNLEKLPSKFIILATLAGSQKEYSFYYKNG